MKVQTLGFKTLVFGRYGTLLITLILVMVLQPTINTLVGKYLLEATFIIVLFGGLRAIEPKKNLLRFEVVLLLVSLALNFAGGVTESHTLYFLGIAGRTLFMILVAIIILTDLFRSNKVTSDTLAGAVCVYLMIALIWGYLFLLIEVMVPGSFSFTQDQGRMHLWVSKDFFPFFYFSLVTITTVGYGDASPVSTEAQTFATTEALIGQVYLTILVARLVGMYLMNQQNESMPLDEE